jgi:LacI family transcriptional regulator, galactose operon repressor
MQITLKEIANATGVSISSVSHILNRRGNYSPKTCKKVISKAKEMGYRPNSTARAMRSGKTHQIGVVILNSESQKHKFHYMAAYEFILGINEYLAKKNYVLSLIHLNKVEKLEENSRVFSENILDGMIVIDSIPKDTCEKIQHEVKNVVWLETNVWEEHCCIRRDEFKVGYQSAKHLINKGYRELLWCGGLEMENTEPHFSIEQRHAGVKQAADESNIELKELSINWSLWRRDLKNWDKIFEAELLEIKRQLTKNIGCIAYNQDVLFWLKDGAARFERYAGQDFGVICCDETAMLREWYPDAARVGFDRYDFGQKAAEMLLKSLEDKKYKPKSILVEPKMLIEGKTI